MGSAIASGPVCSAPALPSCLLGRQDIGKAQKLASPSSARPVSNPSPFDAVAMPMATKDKNAGWAPANAALVRAAGARSAGRLAGGDSETFVITRGVPIRFVWESDRLEDGSLPPIILPEVISIPTRVVQVAAGEAHALFLAFEESVAASRIYSIGANDYGQLGLGDSFPREVHARAWCVESLGPASLVGGIACGGRVSMAVSQRGDVWSWGRNKDCALGLGLIPVACVSVPTAVAQIRHKVRGVQLATTGATSFCVSHLGSLFSWGSGECCLHGHEHEAVEPVPRAIRGLADVPVVQVAGSGLHVVALTSHGGVFTWGRVCGSFGPESQLQKTPRFVDALEGKRIVQVAVGLHHCLALSESGAVYGWGAFAPGVFGSVPKMANRMQVYALVHRVEFPPSGALKGIGCGAYHSMFWTSGSSTDVEEGPPSLWVCGQGKSAFECGAESQTLTPRRVFVARAGTPLKLTKVDVKTILEIAMDA